MEHPLNIGTKVKAMKSSCACRNARQVEVEGTILKVIHNRLGFWYYLDVGTTVKQDAILSVLK